MDSLGCCFPLHMRFRKVAQAAVTSEAENPEENVCAVEYDPDTKANIDTIEPDTAELVSGSPADYVSKSSGYTQENGIDLPKEEPVPPPKPVRTNATVSVQQKRPSLSTKSINGTSLSNATNGEATEKDALLKADRDAAKLKAEREAKLKQKAEREELLRSEKEAERLKAEKDRALQKAERDAATLKAETDEMLRSGNDAMIIKAERDATLLKSEKDSAAQQAEIDEVKKKAERSASRKAEREAKIKADKDAAKLNAEKAAKRKPERDAKLNAEKEAAMLKAKNEANAQKSRNADLNKLRNDADSQNANLEDETDVQMVKVEDDEVFLMQKPKTDPVKQENDKNAQAARPPLVRRLSYADTVKKDRRSSSSSDVAKDAAAIVKKDRRGSEVTKDSAETVKKDRRGSEVTKDKTEVVKKDRAEATLKKDRGSDVTQAKVDAVKKDRAEAVKKDRRGSEVAKDSAETVKKDRTEARKDRRASDAAKDKTEALKRDRRASDVTKDRAETVKKDRTEGTRRKSKTEAQNASDAAKVTASKAEKVRKDKKRKDGPDGKEIDPAEAERLLSEGKVTLSPGSPPLSPGMPKEEIIEENGSYSPGGLKLGSRGKKIIWVARKAKILQLLEDAFPNVIHVKTIMKETNTPDTDKELVGMMLGELREKGLAQELDKDKWARVHSLPAEPETPGPDEDDKRMSTFSQPDEEEDDRRGSIVTERAADETTIVEAAVETMAGEVHKEINAHLDDGEKLTFKPKVKPKKKTRASPKKQHKVQVVDQMPMLPSHEQPRVAIVTLLFSEKLAVDAMMDNKMTYVKYKTEGEGTVYTIGQIGPHKVVSTKLPRIGHGENAMVAAGNTVTRMLGTFGRVEYAFLVGVGGGVANPMDDTKHVRLGDIVVSKPEFNCGPLYLYCNGTDTDSTGTVSFNTQSWNCKDDAIENLVGQRQNDNDSEKPEWLSYLDEAMDDLSKVDSRFYRPKMETDRMFRSIEDRQVEIQHPSPVDGSLRSKYPERPVVHYGLVGSGSMLAKDDDMRRDFALLNEVKAIDCGFHAVMDSVEGNRTDNFAVIRGVADYEEGMNKREWQPYAAVAAAAYMKMLVKGLPSS